LPLDRLADLPGLPHRRTPAHVRALGLDYAQPVWLEGPVLSPHRRDLPHLRGVARGDGVGGLRPGQRPPLRALRHPLRVRAVGGVRGIEQPEGNRAESRVDADGLTFACATSAEERGRLAGGGGCAGAVRECCEDASSAVGGLETTVNADGRTNAFGWLRWIAKQRGDAIRSIRGALRALKALEQAVAT